jgi:hypothetical protein
MLYLRDSNMRPRPASPADLSQNHIIIIQILFNSKVNKLSPKGLQSLQAENVTYNLVFSLKILFFTDSYTNKNFIPW